MKRTNTIIGDQGFSLVEILVALALVAVVFTIVPITSSDNRSNLEEAILNFDRAVKVASNEAILRNTITRIHIKNEVLEDDEEESPIKYSVQFGPSGGIVLPPLKDLSKMSKNDLEEYEKKQKSFHSRFNSIDDDNFKSITLPEGIDFLGIATSYQKEIQSEGTMSIYFYPTGEKDDAIIFLASRAEIADLKIFGFSEETELNYSSLSQRELELRQDSLDNKVKDIHSEWLTN